MSRVSPAPGGCGYTLAFEDGTTRAFGCVVVANGHHSDRRWGGPWAGSDAYTGRVLHSKDYKSPKSLAGQRVLVVGGGNSACDIAAEAARFAARSDVSIKNGVWLMPRLIFGKPMVDAVKPWMPVWVQKAFIRVYLKFVVGRYESYGLQVPPPPRPRAGRGHAA